MITKYRKYIIIAISLLIAFGIGAFIYNAHLYHDDPLEFDEIEANELKIDSKGFFTGKFKCTINGKDLSKYTYEVKNNNLYISLYATSSGEEALAADVNGNVKLRFFAGKNIKKFYYRTDVKDSALTVTKEN
jgi:hypothetical protein